MALVIAGGSGLESVRGLIIVAVEVEVEVEVAGRREAGSVHNMWYSGQTGKPSALIHLIKVFHSSNSFTSFKRLALGLGKGPVEVPEI